MSGTEFDIAKKQLEGLRMRNRRATTKVKETETINRYEIVGDDELFTIEIMPLEENIKNVPENRLAIDLNEEVKPKQAVKRIKVRNGSDVQKKVVKKKMVWDPDTKTVVRDPSVEPLRLELENESTDIASTTIRKIPKAPLTANDNKVGSNLAKKNTMISPRRSTRKTPSDGNVKVDAKSSEANWDPVYKTISDDLLIIRRRSSSFTEDSRTEFIEDAEVEEVNDTSPSPVDAKQSLSRQLLLDMKKKLNKTISETVSNSDPVSPKVRNGEEVTVQRHDRFVEIILRSTDSQCTLFSPLMCKMLCTTLNSLKTDQLVLLSPMGFMFGENLNKCVPQTQSVGQRRRDLKNALSEYRIFLETIMQYKKPLGICLDGIIDGISVAMLPLFDLVFVSKTTTFLVDKRKYGKSVLLNSMKLNANLMARMVFLQETITAHDAINGGLVTKVIDDSFRQTVINKCSAIDSLTVKMIVLAKSKYVKLGAPFEVISQELTDEADDIVEEMTKEM